MPSSKATRRIEGPEAYPAGYVDFLTMRERCWLNFQHPAGFRSNLSSQSGLAFGLSISRANVRVVRGHPSCDLSLVSMYGMEGVT